MTIRCLNQFEYNLDHIEIERTHERVTKYIVRISLYYFEDNLSFIHHQVKCIKYHCSKSNLSILLDMGTDDVVSFNSMSASPSTAVDSIPTTFGSSSSITIGDLDRYKINMISIC